MKKIPLMFLFLLIFTAVPVLALTADVAYVVKNNVESSLKSELNLAGLDYDVITEGEITETDFSQYKMILVGNDNFDNPEDIPVSQYNSLLINSYHFYKKGTGSNYQWGWSERKGSSSSPTSMKLNGLDTIITDGIPESLNGYVTNDINIKTSYITGRKATELKYVVYKSGSSSSPSEAILAIAYPGVEYLNGETEQARSLFFGVTDSDFWTADTRDLFRNSLDWVLVGEDRDGDGFYSDDDCDNDDFDINPDADEIAYDGIDQDCSGSDLTDVDEDGHDSEIVGGNDCNDEDAGYNIDSPDKTKNCVNDAPSVSNIPNFIIREDQTVTIFIIASDSENDNLTYSINDSRFEKLSDNSFSWKTDFFSAGTHVFEASVSDEEFTTAKTFNVEVRDRNQEPILNESIPEQVWDEDQNHTLDLNDYFKDLDETDILEFGVDDTSSDTSIAIESILNGIVKFIVEQNWNGVDWIKFFAYDGDDLALSNRVELNVNAVNDAPVFVGEIPDQTWNEDSKRILDLSNYFSDVDSNLTYSLTGNSEISIESSDLFEVTFVPSSNWNGEEIVVITASDGEFDVDSNELVLRVLPVNDAPVLDPIEDVHVLREGIVEIVPTASDVENDSLNFIFSSPLDNQGKWQTQKSDVGVYTTGVVVNDGQGGENSYEFKINVLGKFLINEFSVNPGNGEDWVEIYNPSSKEIGLESCLIKNQDDLTFDLSNINGGLLEGKGFGVVEMNNNLDNDQGFLELYCFNELIDRVTYGNFDGGNLEDNVESLGFGESASRTPDGRDTGNNRQDFEILEYPTKDLPRDTDMIPPVVELVSPENDFFFSETRNIEFVFMVGDNQAETLECSVYLDDVVEGTKNSIINNSVETILVKGTPDGEYNWKVRCYDGVNHAFSANERGISISAPDNPFLNSIGSKNVNENETLEFSISSSDPDLDEMVFDIKDAPQGSNFEDNGDGTALFSWTPNYQQSGEYEVTFLVSDSTNLEDEETVTIIVKEQREPPKFKDIDRCELTDSGLKIEIREPDKGDDFEFGEEVEIKVKIENTYFEDLDVDVEVFLYDGGDEDVLENDRDNVDVDAGDSETFKFLLDIPKDLDDNDFYVFVLAEGDGEDKICNEKYVYVNVERKDHELVIEEVSILPQIVSQGGNTEVIVEVQNMGGKDEDVYIEIKNSELGILEKSEEFELERYGDDDEETKTFYIEIPENVEDGEYSLEIRVVSDDARDSLVEKISVLKGEYVSDDSSVSVEGQKEDSLVGGNGESSGLGLVLLLSLITTFVLVFTIITIFLKRFKVSFL